MKIKSRPKTLKEGLTLKDEVTHAQYWLYRNEDGLWYMHVTPEDRKRGYTDGEPMLEIDMVSYIVDREELKVVWGSK